MMAGLQIMFVHMSLIQCYKPIASDTCTHTRTIILLVGQVANAVSHLSEGCAEQFNVRFNVRNVSWYQLPRVLSVCSGIDIKSK